MKPVTHIPGHARYMRRSCRRIKGLFWEIIHGKYFSFHKCHSSLSLLFATCPFGRCEIWGDAIRIVGIVIVRVAVGVDIAEIVVVVVIRGTLPPISREPPTHPGRFCRNTPIYYEFTCLQLFPYGFALSDPCHSLVFL